MSIPRRLLVLAPAALLAWPGCGPASQPSPRRAPRGATARPGDPPRRREPARRARPSISTGTILEAIKRNPEKAELHFVLGKRYHDGGILAQAEISYRNAAKFKPDYFEPRYNLGILYMQQKRLADAARWFGRALKIRPTDADTHQKVALCLLHGGDLDAAEQALKGYAKLEGQRGHAYFLLGIVSHRRKHSAKALAWFKRAAKAGYSTAKLHNRIGVIQRRLKRRGAALASFRAAVAADPNHALGRANLGGMLLIKGDYAGAFKHLQVAAQKRPKDGSILVNLGLAGLRLGKYADVLDALRRVQALAPKLALAKLAYGVALVFTGKVPKGGALLKAAVKKRKSLAGTLGSYFQPLVDRNNCKGAVAVLEAILVGQPKNAVARRNLGIMKKRCK